METLNSSLYLEDDTGTVRKILATLSLPVVSYLFKKQNKTLM